MHTTLPTQAKEQLTLAQKSEGSETNAHKPRNGEGEHWEPKHVHTNSGTQRPCWVAETRVHKPHDVEGGPQELRVRCTQPCDTESEFRGLKEAHTSHCDAEEST